MLCTFGFEDHVMFHAVKINVWRVVCIPKRQECNGKKTPAESIQPNFVRRLKRSASIHIVHGL